MATRTAPTRAILRAPLAYATPARRPFFSLPEARLQVVQAQRTLPFTPDKVYALIADVEAYPRFLPKIKAARVTQWAKQRTPPAHQDSPIISALPARADLEVGVGTFRTEKWTSRLFCVPARGIIEALSGDAATELSMGELHRLGYDVSRPGSDGANTGEIMPLFKTMVARWTVEPLAAGQMGNQPGCNVNLCVKFQFVSRFLSSLVIALGDEAADAAVEAFVKEAERVLR